MRGLILVLMSTACYLAVFFIFLVITWWLLLVTQWLLVVTARYLLVTDGYCSLLVFTARYRSLLLVPTFSMNEETIEINKFLLKELLMFYISLDMDKCLKVKVHKMFGHQTRVYVQQILLL